MNEQTIKISQDAYQRLVEHKKKTGASIRFTVDQMVNCYIPKEKYDPIPKDPKRIK